jgi:YD repeat-containing protein
MGFFRAAFARVFFKVSNALSAIAWSVLLAATTMVFLLKNTLMRGLAPNFPQDLTPKWIRQIQSIAMVMHWAKILLLSLVMTLSFSEAMYAGVPAGVATQPPTRYVYVPSWFIFGMNEGSVSRAFPSSDSALDSMRAGICSNTWICHENTAMPGKDGWYFGFQFCRWNDPYYCSWAGAQKVGVCPNNTTGYWSFASDGSGAYYGYIACSVGNIDKEKNSCQRPGVEPVGNPILPGTGQKFITEPIYRSASGMNFSLYFRYDGGNLIDNTTWRHNFYKFMVFDGLAPPSSVRVHRGQSAFIFRQQVSGLWSPDADISDTLAQLPNSAGWKYTTSDDSVELYDANGKLQSITNRAGLTQSLIYSDGTNGSTSGNGGYVLDATGNVTTTILPAGMLIRVTDSSNRSLNFGYDASSRIVNMIDPSGGVYLYKYDEISSTVLSGQPLGNNLTSITYPDGYKKIYSYNEQTLTGNTNLPNALTGITDTTASDTTGTSGTRYANYAYDPQGRAFDENHAPNMPGGPVDHYNLAYSTDTSGNPLTVVTDPRGTARTYHFTTVLGVVKSTGTDQPGGSSCGAASSNITYDPNGNISSRLDFTQHKTCYAYDLTRNLETARIEGLNSTDDCATALAASTLSGVARKVTTVWDTTYRLPHLITEAVGKPEERVTTINYDPTSGNVLSQSIKDTASGKTRTWTYSYTTAADNTLVNLLKSVDGPRTDVADITTYTYYTADDTATPIKYRRGDLWKITNALSQTTTITSYDGNGCPLTIIAPNTVTTTLIYWPRGWLKSKTIGSKTTLYNYDNVGNLTKVTLGDGSFIQYTYDAAHRMTDISDILLNRIHYTLDAIGNRVKEEVFDSNSKLSTVKARDFDPLNRLWHDIAYFNDPNTPVATQYSYDANGNLTTVTPPANNSTDTTYRTTTFSYDALNRLSYIFDPINTTVHPSTYTYNALDQLQSVTDPRQLINSYTTNALGSTTVQTSPDKGTINRTVDEAGNVKTETYANSIQASYTYDALNRLITASFPTLGENITLTWDNATGCTYGIGQLCQITDAGGSMTFAYDDQGNRIKETRLISGASFVTQYSFDGANRPGVQTLPSSRTATLARNTAGQINGMTSASGATNTTVEQQITYDGTGQVTSQTMGNGLILKASYDLSGASVAGRFNKPDGDLNGDGIVNVVDVMFAEQIATGLRTPTPDQLDHGDVSPPGNPDGKIDVRDVSRIMRKAFGLENF